MLITSLQNPRIKEVLHLRRRPARDKQGLFIIEGYRELLRASEVQWPLRTLFFCPELFLGENNEELLKMAKGAQLIEVSRHVFEKIAYRDRPDGLLALGVQKELTLDNLPKRDQGLILVAEAIEKPGNLGTMLRTCDAFGALGVMICDPVTDVYNPNVVRASLGTLFCQPVAKASSEEGIAYLKREGYQIVAATPAGDTDLRAMEFAPKRAVVIGAEQYGLSALWMEGADARAAIEMHGHSDSLNAAIAASLFIYAASIGSD